MRIRRLVLVGLLAPCCTVPAIAQDVPQEPPITVVETPPPPPRTTSRVAQSLVDRGIRLLSSGEMAEAVSELDAALAIDPGIALAWSHRGMALAQMDRNAEAAESFDRADAIEPGLVDTLRGRGFLAFRQNRNAEARDLLTRALDIEPDNAFALFYRSGALFGEGEAELALADNEAAIAASPRWFMPRAWGANLQMSLGRTEQALAAVDAIAEDFPNDGFATATAIQLLGMLGEDARAEALLARGRDAAENPVMLFTSAQRRPINETDLKLAELNRAIELAPDYVMALTLRGQTLWAEYEYEAALADARRVMELSPDFMPGYSLAAQILVELNRRTQARNLADGLAESHADNPEALLTAANIHRQLGNTARAEDLLSQSAASTGSGPAQVRALLARMERRPVTDLGGREADINAALTIDPDSVGALYQLSWVQQQKGDFSAAVETLSRYVELDGRDAYSVNNLAVGLALAARHDEAEALFQEVRSLAVTASDLNSICWIKVINNVALERAEEECRASLALTDRPETRDSLAMVLLRQGRLTEALAEYDKVLAVSNLPVSRFARAIVRARLGDRAGARSDASEARRLPAQLDEFFTLWGIEIPADIAL